MTGRVDQGRVSCLGQLAKTPEHPQSHCPDVRVKITKKLLTMCRGTKQKSEKGPKGKVKSYNLNILIGKGRFTIKLKIQ